MRAPCPECARPDRDHLQSCLFGFVQQEIAWLLQGHLTSAPAVRAQADATRELMRRLVEASGGDPRPVADGLFGHIVRHLRPDDHHRYAIAELARQRVLTLGQSGALRSAPEAAHHLLVDALARVVDEEGELGPPPLHDAVPVRSSRR